MARNGNSTGKQPASQPTSGKARWGDKSPIKWVNGYLNAADVEWLVAHDKQCADLVLEFIDALPEAATFSCKYESNSDRYLASIVFTGDGDPNDGWGCSMRGATRVDAIYALAYIVAEKYKWSLGTVDERNGNTRWG